MQIRRVQVEGPERTVTLSYTEWGAADSVGTVLCVHGLTRNARDFDQLAADLAAEMRVICPDMVGRGRSDRLMDPEHYVLPTYMSHMVQLIEKMNLDEVDWVGTSMGGMIGMALAAA
ncbi:MAG: alpha/beta fold hydrolase, partial [Pseudomonadota bacterium]